MGHTEAQLETFARVHLRYEVVTLHRQVIALVDWQAQGRPADATYDALIEACLVHLRLLNDFLGFEPRKDDVSARHYLPGWKLGSVLTETERKGINAQVAHLSMRRKLDWTWNLGELTSKILKVFTKFLDQIREDERSEVRARAAYFPADPDYLAAIDRSVSWPPTAVLTNTTSG